MGSLRTYNVNHHHICWEKKKAYILYHATIIERVIKVLSVTLSVGSDNVGKDFTKKPITLVTDSIPYYLFPIFYSRP